MPTACIGVLECNKSAAATVLLTLLLLTFLLALELLLQLGHCSSIVASISNATILQRASIEAWAIVVVTMSDHFTATHHNSAMAIVQWRLCGLLQAKRQIVVSLHFEGT